MEYILIVIICGAIVFYIRRGILRSQNIPGLKLAIAQGIEALRKNDCEFWADELVKIESKLGNIFLRPYALWKLKDSFGGNGSLNDQGSEVVEENTELQLLLDRIFDEMSTLDYSDEDRLNYREAIKENQLHPRIGRSFK